ncbi:Mov34/MPN/PAD-1 family protein [Symmachiella macrocystis]|uniref:Mov34/MPN/PAD-1 family protein n=1 Tax=Symmachiella macrocystis TaxID=2527985 RepID=A0A5C6AYG9_9PLAN|nr:Mov34/MPN/PAD-1 family protein [Symmachiella macrocystis]TWU04162.1 Mov34/MPN/PAD-1 family protein [Symmachiella macrocystis]
MTDSSMSLPDVRQIVLEELPQADFPVNLSEDFRVHFTEKCHVSILAHAEEDTSVEICGVLVGGVQHDAHGPFALISEHIRADAATSKFAEVTFTHEAWSKINAEMDSRYSDLSIVGWYHTHPDFGIFLSDRDEFIHQNFFSGASQIAHVVDPIRKTEGVFVWREGKPHLCSHFWVGDEIRAETQRETAAGQSPPQPGAPEAVVARVENAAPGPLYFWMCMALVFLLGYMLSGILSNRRSNWEQRMIFRGVVQEYGIIKNLRPGLKRHLDAVDSGLGLATLEIEKLSKEHALLAGDEKNKIRKQWRTVLNTVAKSQKQLDVIEATYCLTNEESEIVEGLLKQILTDAAPQPASPKSPSEQKTSESSSSDKPPAE